MKKSFLFLILPLTAITFGQNKLWTLEQCVQYALKNNINIKQTHLDVENASIEKMNSKGNFAPSVNANASHSWNIGLNQDITTGILRNQTNQFTAMGISLDFDIYKGLQNQNALRRANLAFIASQYKLIKMQEDVALNVTNAFLQVLYNKENLKIQQQQLSISEQQLNRTQEMVNLGATAKGDLFEIKASIANYNQAIITAQNALLISKLSLAQLLQIKDFDDFDVVESDKMSQETVALLQTPMEIYNNAKENRTEIKIAKTNLAVAEKNMAFAKGSFLPSLKGFYTFNTRISYADVIAQNNGLLITQPAPPFWNQFNTNKGNAFGLQLNVPIFNGFSIKANVEKSKVALEKSKIDLEQQSLDLQRNIYIAFTDAKGAINAHKAAIIALESRKEAFNYAKEKYNAGLFNAFEINQSQTLLSNAQSEVIKTQFDAVFKIKIIEFYFGIPIIKN